MLQFSKAGVTSAGTYRFHLHMTHDTRSLHYSFFSKGHFGIQITMRLLFFSPYFRRREIPKVTADVSASLSSSSSSATAVLPCDCPRGVRSPCVHRSPGFRRRCCAAPVAVVACGHCPECGGGGGGGGRQRGEVAALRVEEREIGGEGEREGEREREAHAVRPQQHAPLLCRSERARAPAAWAQTDDVTSLFIYPFTLPDLPQPRLWRFQINEKITFQHLNV